MRIVWKSYIDNQRHWAERLSALAEDQDPATASKFKCPARRAWESVRDAIRLQSTTCGV